METLILFALLQAPPQEQVQFNRDIRPILSEYCLKCHGPDARSRKANLRLDTREGAFGAIEGRFPIVAGHPGKSEVWKRLVTPDGDDRMPPAKTGKRPSAGQIALIRRWIEQGALWQGHWSLIAPERSAIPVVRDAKWPAGDIDRFILARLGKEGLRPSPPTDRATLARRVTLDLTGLPPTPEEVDAFVRDSSPGAYESLVDRLLASPRYGEHMARFWLDLARYGDTHGLHLDNYREIWPYRDWVIKAFNDNLPFDRFVTWQLAGDLLENPTREQQVASGFNRCHVTTSEGGSIEEEVHCRNVFDRVETFGQVFLAMTFTCARCHDHKFDPIPQKDYYALFAYFNSLEGPDLDGNKKDPAPVVKVPDEPQGKELDRLTAAIRQAQERMDGPQPGIDPAQVAWERDLAKRLPSQWTPLDPVAFKVASEASLREGEDKSVQAGGMKLVYEVSARSSLPAIQAVRVEILPPSPAPAGEAPLPFALSGVEAEIAPAADLSKAERIDLRAAAAFTPSDLTASNLLDQKRETGWTGDARKRPSVVLLPAKPFGLKEGAELTIRLIHEGDHAKQPVPRFRISISTDAELVKGITPSLRGPWHLLGRFPAADGNAAFTTEFGPEKGVELAKAHGELQWQKREDFADGKDLPYPEGIGASFVYRTITAPTPRKLTFSVSSDDAIQVWLNGALVLSRNVKRTFRRYDADKVAVDLDAGENRLLFKFSNHGTSNDHKFFFDVVEEQANDLLQDAADALAAAPEKRTEAQKASLRTRYRREHWPEWGPIRREIAGLRGQETALLDKVSITLVSREKGQPRDAFILKRGEYDKKGEKIGRATPTALPPPAKDLPVNRLGLSKWLLDPSHPLLARAAVNRLWQQLFGTGLVRTSEDFGSQGEPPFHPELLDHLAAGFASTWDVKRFMKDLVLSATYRQSSRVTADLVRRDPENRLLARGPRYRLDAEMVRDQVLFLGGLLVERLGGPSFKAPQPEGLWEAVGYTGSNTYRFARDKEPEKVFRRSLYIFWKRTSAPPQMTMFDAPSRETCVARRERTNTPLQALLLMNEPQCWEAARHLAQKAMKEGGTAPGERATWMLRRCTLRTPAPRDVADLVGLYHAQHGTYVRDPEAAKKAVAAGDIPPDPALDPAELAAWTLVANAVLNLDEVVNK